MREYSKVGPKFWIGETGKAIKKKGMEAIIVASYLMTSPHSNMLGLYYQPVMFIAHETGIGMEGASKGLAGCIEAGFCLYDEASEIVWVIEMAYYQIAEELDPKDNRCKGVQNEYNSLPENTFLSTFYEKYHGAFHMTDCRGMKVKKEAPSKPLASQEQEQEQAQEQEQKQEQEQVCEAASGPAAPKVKKLDPEKQSACRNTWDAYAKAYYERHGAEPVRNAKVNRNIVDFVDRLGYVEAPHVAAFFVGHNNAYYVREMHSVSAMLKDAEKLRTEWATNSKMTQTKAMQADKTQTNLDAFAPLIAAARAKEEAERNANAD